jgi:BirA family biotin operon repressor/biotin-[acetyl-CoA-carboxylase] ligase
VKGTTDRVADAWHGRPIGDWRREWQVPGLYIFRTVTSTNDVAMRLADEGAPARTVVIADTQTAGRGRQGRRWAGADGSSLLLSAVFRPAAESVDPSTMPIRVGLAAALAVEAVAGLAVQLKWPNDLLLPDGRKLGGVLCEGATGAGAPWLVAGTGINLGQTEADFEGLTDAVSVRMAGQRIHPPELVAALLTRLSPFAVTAPPIDPVAMTLIEQRDALRGREVTVDGRPAGIAIGIDPDGFLVLRSGEAFTRVAAGTVRPVGRAASSDNAGDDAAPMPRHQSEASR